MKTQLQKKLPKVLLVNPPQKIYPHAWNSGLYYPVGLLYVAGVIREICELKILDCMVLIYLQFVETYRRLLSFQHLYLEI